MTEPQARKKRTIQDIRDSKKTGERMVYMSVPNYTSAKWAEMAGVDVAVVGDSLAMIAHGHSSTIPATMDMMIMHSQAVRRGARGPRPAEVSGSPAASAPPASRRAAGCLQAWESPCGAPSDLLPPGDHF